MSTYNNYIALISKEDILSIFIHGCCHPYFPIVKITKNPNKRNLKDLLSLSNPFEYSFEKFVVFIRTEKELVNGKDTLTSESVSSDEITQIIALSYKAQCSGIQGLGADIQSPIDEHTFEKFLVEQKAKNSEQGIKDIFTLAGINFNQSGMHLLTKYPDFIRPKHIETAHSITEGLESHSKKDSIWTFLLTYTRHQAYPDGILGYALDSIHIAFSHAQGQYGDQNMKNTKLWENIFKSHNQNLGLNSNNTPDYSLLKDIVSIIQGDKKFKERIKKTPKDFFYIAIVFLEMKEELQRNANHIASKYGSLRIFLDHFKKYLIDRPDIYEKVLILIGITLEHTGYLSYTAQKS